MLIFIALGDNRRHLFADQPMWGELMSALAQSVRSPERWRKRPA
ncbi:hypothetical protein [Anabaena azotica]|nr:hypothetical protein [Anabaena azotica]